MRRRKVMRMGTMISFVLRSFFGCVVLFGLVFACSEEPRRVSGGGDSEYHFLESCTNHCEGGLTCLCGVCTKACEISESCQDLASTAECTPACGASVRACDLPCSAASECATLGA